MKSFISTSFFIDIAIIIGFFTSIGVFFLILNSALKKEFKTILRNLLIICSISLVGYIVGVITGNSRNPIVDVLLPLLFTFLGGLSTYVVTRSKTQNRVLTAVLSAFFTVFTLIGLWAGASNRIESENTQKIWEKELLEYETDLELYLYKQKKVIDLHYLNDLRNNGLSLPD
ncbi:MAG: hypothetical protein KAU17_12655 [Spirochaetales bacterium]|nr:hypothetical protein [Spirochaetales bacterium]